MKFVLKQYDTELISFDLRSGGWLELPGNAVAGVIGKQQDKGTQDFDGTKDQELLS